MPALRPVPKRDLRKFLSHPYLRPLVALRASLDSQMTLASLFPFRWRFQRSINEEGRGGWLELSSPLFGEIEEENLIDLEGSGVPSPLALSIEVPFPHYAEQEPWSAPFAHFVEWEFVDTPFIVDEVNVIGNDLNACRLQ